jgi:hypothetical protein
MTNIEKLQDIHHALDLALGDTDPLWRDDMTDEEIRDQFPVFWAAKEIAYLISRGDS